MGGGGGWGFKRQKKNERKAKVKKKEKKKETPCGIKRMREACASVREGGREIDRVIFIFTTP